MVVFLNHRGNFDGTNNCGGGTSNAGGTTGDSSTGGATWLATNTSSDCGSTVAKLLCICY